MSAAVSAADIGFEVEYKHNLLKSEQLAVANSNEDDLELSAHFGNSRQGGSLSAGINSNGAEELGYTTGSYYLRDSTGNKELLSTLELNRVADGSDLLRLSAKEDKAELALRAGFGRREFLRFSGSVNELTDRSTDERILSGVGATVELGTAGSFGTNNWTMGVSATGARNENDFAATNSQALSLSASLFRGGIRSDYPQAPNPRYQLSAQVGHNWPSDTTALQIQAGAGFRVLGNDELSLQFSHDTPVEELLDTDPNSTVGIQYTNHF